MTSKRLKRARPLVLLLALVFAAPVLASDTFFDVPASNPHHADITTIKVAGITQGCNPPDNTLYCPADAVRRDQMASFLQRGLGRAARASTSIFLTTIDSTSFQDAATVSIAAPGSGFVLVNGAVSIQNGGSACTGFDCGVFVQLRHNNVAAVSPYVVVDADAANSPNNTAAVAYVFPVSAGTNTISLQVRKASTSVTMSYFSAQLTGLYVPFGSTGANALGSSAPAPASGDTPGGVAR
jgi:hypothetical protein